MVLRISGLASGMNIDEIVESMIKAESIPLDRMKQDKTTLEWKRDDYREINTALFNFRSEIADMRYTSYYRTRTTTSSDDSLVSTSATSGAGQGSYSISKVSELAQAAYQVNTGSIIKDGEDKNINLNRSLYDLQNQFANGNFGWKTGTVRKETIAFVDGEIKLNLPDGTQIINTNTYLKNSDMSVEVNGKSYGVVITSEEEVMPEDVPVGQVYVNAQSGQLFFSKQDKESFKESDSINVQYVTDFAKQTKTITKDTKEISLDVPIYKNTNDFTATLTSDDGNILMNLKVTNDGNLVDASGVTQEVFGRLNFDTGEITELKLPEGFADNSSIILDVKFQQQYLAMDITTQTSNGEQYERFQFQNTDSLNTIFNKVNESDVGITMFYDSHTGRVTMNRKETGNFSKVAEDDDISFRGKFLTDALQFQNSIYTDGVNAKFEINGLETERSSNTFSINGASFTLKKTFNNTDNPVTVTVNNDTDKFIENIKSFVEKYNELIETIEKKTNEERYKDYKPMLDYEREKLSDKQQEQWEEKAKSGLLRNDPILTQFISQARSLIYTSVNQPGINSSYNSLAELGITTTTDYRTAKLKIDENKLREAIEKDPESVELVFRGSGDTTSQKGIINRLYDVASSSINRLRDRAGNSGTVNNNFTIGRELNSIDDDIERFEDKLLDLETRYYRQFTAMEKAIARANSQAGYLAQFFM